MSAKVVLDGFDALVAELTKAPAEIRAQGMEIIRQETEGHAQEVRNAYGQHRVTGNLERGVNTEYPSTQVLIGIVRSKARHASIYENGTDVRRTNNGANRGRMPKPSPQLFVPLAIRRRERMRRRLADMLRGLGFQVTGI